MTFADERAAAEAALAHRGHGAPPPYPSVAARIRARREELCLSELQLEARVEEQGQRLCPDLELYDYEAFVCATLGDLLAVARGLETSVGVLLFGEEPPAETGECAYSRVADELRERLSRSGLLLEEFSTRIGWCVEPVLKEPIALLGYCLDGLRDICAAVGVDWVSVAMYADRRNVHAESAD